MLQEGVTEPPPVFVACGKPAYRLPYRTEQVLANRITMGHITQAQVDDGLVAGYATVVDCSLVGEYVSITWPDWTVYPYLVIDCRDRTLPPYPKHLAWTLAVEVDKAHWEQRYNWHLFALKVPVTVRSMDWTPGRN